MITIALGAAALLAASAIMWLAYRITRTNTVPEAYLAFSMLCTIVLLAALTALLLGGA